MDRILSLISHYGYLVVFFGVMLESTGVPLPGETILLAAGLMVQRGHLDLGDTIACGMLGAVIHRPILLSQPRKGSLHYPSLRQWLVQQAAVEAPLARALR
jgi:membrane protein DedA with SNARE-associated domain